MNNFVDRLLDIGRLAVSFVSCTETAMHDAYERPSHGHRPARAILLN